MENEKKEISSDKVTLRVTGFSRRQFLKRATVAAAGATLAAVALSASCKSPVNTTPGTNTATSNTNPTNPINTTVSIPPTSNSTTPVSPPPTSTSVIPGSTLPTSTSVIPGSNPPVSTYSYTPPTVLPQLLPVPGTACVVAADRVYSTDHIWVKTIATGIAAMGITTTLNEILFEPFKILLPKVGDKLAQGDAFGTIEGYKMISDLLTPVSGTVIQINDFLNSLVRQGTVLEPVINDPYNSGWMIVVQMAKPGELASLLTAQAYRDLVGHK